MLEKNTNTDVGNRESPKMDKDHALGCPISWRSSSSSTFSTCRVAGAKNKQTLRRGRKIHGSVRGDARGPRDRAENGWDNAGHNERLPFLQVTARIQKTKANSSGRRHLAQIAEWRCLPLAPPRNPPLNWS